ncbi:MAG: lipoyl(octanoyl) transferase LipB, partial [Deltaproteobacteria bacterium]|nr:lipoyl(octanoyl) transferase LipB [Deltaproteobacteria bacterium]
MKWKIHIARDLPFTALENLQGKFAESVLSAKDLGVLLLSEPKATYTCGRSGLPGELLTSVDNIKTHGIATHHVSRGGKWTYHGPGQLLVYPIVKLTELGYSRFGVRNFLHTLRLSIRAYLEKLGLNGVPGHPFGLYVADKKLVSFGISVERGICRHGLSLYIKNQSDHFRNIDPCGIRGQKVTSLCELGVDLPWEEIATQLAEMIKK